MTETTVVHLLALVGSVTYMAQAVPAAVRLLRTKDVGGVSGPSLEVLLISSVWWLAYSIEIGNIPSTVSSAVGLVGTVIAVVTLARLGGLGSRAPLAIAAGLGLMLLVWHEPMVVGAVAAATGALYSIPQAVRLHRRLDESVEGVSLGAWVLTGINGATWLVYGILIGHPILGAAGLISVPVSLWICTTIVRRRRAEASGPGLPALDA
ncbi:MAG: hypothetical protein ACKOA9_01260 [Actinomycetota bacterium]